MNQSHEQEKLLAEQELRQQEQAAQEKEGPPQDSDIRQLITEECYTKNYRKQKKNMEETMLELVEVCRQKELYCMHDNVDDLIESALNFKLLSINLNSQRLDKKKQEVKNVVEQLAEHITRIVESLQNFRVIQKSSTSLKNTSQISPVHAIAPILSTEEPKYSLTMGLMERLITINPCPRPTVNANTIVESLTSSLIPVPDNDSQREEIDIVTETDELLSPGFENDDSEGEIDVLEELHVDNSISNSENELSDNEASDLIICHFHVLLRNHQMMSLILSLILER
nr:hypothetical protein [Tanacetum cinerariifolium]